MKRALALAFAAVLVSACSRGAESPYEEEEETQGNATGCGTERWNVKTGIDPDVGQVQMAPQLIPLATLTDTTVYPAPASINTSRDSLRFAYSGSPEMKAFLLKNVTLTKYKAEDDLDYHLVVADASGKTMIVELADPTCVNGAWKAQATAARAAFSAVHTATSSFVTANDVVSVTGVGYFDPMHGQTGVAPNGLELHSVLSICFGVDCQTPDFSVAANPGSFAGNGASAINVTSIQGFAGNVSLALDGLPSGASAAFSTTTINGGAGTSELTLSVGSASPGNYPLTITATSGTYVHTAQLSWTVLASGSGLGNGNFEQALTAWTTSGSTSASNVAHGGAQSAMVGSATPSTDSSISQTFALPANATRIEVWYRVTCPDSITYDWVTATLRDNASGTTTTFLPKTCTNDGQWKLATVNVGGGRNVTLTFTTHDDNYTGDATYALFDDVTIATGSPDVRGPTVSVTSPADGATVSGTVTFAADASDDVGVTSLSLVVDGTPVATGPAFAWNTATVADGNHTLTARASDAAGHLSVSTPVVVTVANVTGVVNPVANAGFEAGALTGWTVSGVTSARNLAHTGSWSAQLGSTSPTTDSTAAQTFTLPAGATTLGFWYRVACPDTVAYDWATATLRDNDAGTTTTLLARTCSNDGAWRPISANVSASAGHSVTLTFVNHDDNYAGDPTWSLWDDVTVR